MLRTWFLAPISWGFIVIAKRNTVISAQWPIYHKKYTLNMSETRLFCYIWHLIGFYRHILPLHTKQVVITRAFWFWRVVLWCLDGRWCSFSTCSLLVRIPYLHTARPKTEVVAVLRPDSCGAHLCKNAERTYTMWYKGDMFHLFHTLISSKIARNVFRKYLIRMCVCVRARACVCVCVFVI